MINAEREQECAQALGLHGGGMTKQQLARTLNVANHTAWGYLTDMERLGYVTRQPGVGATDPAVFTLTDSGRTLAMREDKAND